ncbi:MAG: hypothetical protein IBX63_08925 [Coriobacteriia bacterium]|nr:hypothetical protein [Coriobacteriia bacterium]
MERRTAVVMGHLGIQCTARETSGGGLRALPVSSPAKALLDALHSAHDMTGLEDVMDRVRAAVIGTGNMGRHHIRILGSMPDVYAVERAATSR